MSLTFSQQCQSFLGIHSLLKEVKVSAIGLERGFNVMFEGSSEYLSPEHLNLDELRGFYYGFAAAKDHLTKIHELENKQRETEIAELKNKIMNVVKVPTDKKPVDTSSKP
jgi:hypothetical protein